jgi:hypothetical protein
MLDNSPELKWSGAWWAKYFLGIGLSLGLAGMGVFSLIAGHSFVFWRTMGRGYSFVAVYGFQAQLMTWGYFALAVASFSYFYMRQHMELSAWYEIILAISLLGAVIAIGWCSVIFTLGL